MKRSEHLKLAVAYYIDHVDDVYDGERSSIIDFILFMLLEYVENPTAALKEIADDFKEHYNEAL